MSEPAFYGADELDAVVARMARQVHGLVEDPARLRVGDVHVPPYETEFEIRIGRREPRDVSRP